ncbi:oxidoreductase family protein [Gordonia soli]|nr:oxidoreductase family protein [Gordonia soli]
MTQIDAPASQLPFSVNGLTPEWLSDALTQDDRAVIVADVDVTRIIWGSATKVFATLTFAENARDIPTQVCIKGGFDERSRAFGLGPAYELEGHFYRDLAPGFAAEVPASFYAATEADQGVIIMEDLTARGAEFGDATDLWPVDDVATTLEVQAKWHAALWGSTKGDRKWLPIGAKAARDAFTVMLSPEVFHPLIERPEVPELSAGLRDDARVRAGFARLWEHDDAATHTINHGDAHFAQLYRVPGAAPAYLDWQTACLAPWAHDVSYFLGSALSIEDRRTRERELVRHYADALAGYGGPRLDDEEAWYQYRLHTLHGFAWMCVPTVMQPSAVVEAMAHRYGAALEDHDPIGMLLG